MSTTQQGETAQPGETEIRAMRNSIYGPCTDKSWEACKDAWMRKDSVEWLRGHITINESNQRTP